MNWVYKAIGTLLPEVDMNLIFSGQTLFTPEHHLLLVCFHSGLDSKRNSEKFKVWPSLKKRQSK